MKADSDESGEVPRESSAGSRAGQPRESTVSVRVVRALTEAVKQAGVAPERFLAAAQLGPEQLDAVEDRLPLSRVWTLCELALDLTGDPALGLHWAASLGEGNFAPISNLLLHSATLRQGLELLNHFHRLLSDHVSHQLIERDDTATLQVAPLTGASERTQRFYSEMTVAGLSRIVRYVGPPTRAPRVCFEYAAPAYYAEYARICGGDVHFNQRITGIVFDRALLDLPPPHKDNDVHQVLLALAERRLLRVTQRTPYVQRVFQHLVQQPNPLRVEMNTVARALELGIRSLRRRLADEGKSFNEIADEAFTLVAKNLLREKRRTIQETAFEMGFSDASAFHRAFKRCAGITPSAYREAPLDDELA